MNNYTDLADNKTLELTVKNLNENGFAAATVENGKEAFKKVTELIPTGAEVMTATSRTLDEIGLTEELNNSGKYNSVKTQLAKLDRKTDSAKMQKLGAAPEYVVGSVHAVTKDGHVLIASMSGSQLPAYVYGSQHVIWVVSTKKITENIADATKRVYEHVLPLESERAHKAYGIPGSFVAKLLIYNKEFTPNRITIIFVKEELGF